MRQATETQSTRRGLIVSVPSVSLWPDLVRCRSHAEAD